MTTTATSLDQRQDSTSTREHTNKMLVRHRTQDTLSAHPLQLAEVFSLPDGSKRAGYPLDWVIYRQDLVVDVVPHAIFERLYEPVTQGLVVPDEARPQLERVLGIGTTKDVRSLLDAVARLAKLSVGNIQIDFTPGQWEELTRRAAVQNQPLATYLERMVAKLTQDLRSL